MRPIDLPSQDLLEHVVKVAHEAWRCRMMEQGWMPGEKHDEHAQVCPLLVPWDQLRLIDRDHSYVSNLWADVLDTMVNEYGSVVSTWAEQLCADDVPIGTHVMMKSSRTQPAAVGVVTSLRLTPAETGRLLRIVVRWNDDDVREHLPHDLMVMPQ